MHTGPEKGSPNESVRSRFKTPECHPGPRFSQDGLRLSKGTRLASPPRPPGSTRRSKPHRGHTGGRRHRRGHRCPRLAETLCGAASVSDARGRSLPLRSQTGRIPCRKRYSSDQSAGLADHHCHPQRPHIGPRTQLGGEHQGDSLCHF